MIATTSAKPQNKAEINSHFHPDSFVCSVSCSTGAIWQHARSFTIENTSYFSRIRGHKWKGSQLLPIRWWQGALLH